MLAAFLIIYSSCELNYVYAADGRLNEDDEGWIENVHNLNDWN